jgi:hypothetical protein
MNPTELRNYIVANPQSTLQLFAGGYEQALWGCLTPDPTNGFSAEQRALLANLWLLATPLGVEATNDTLRPLHRQISSRETIEGETVIPCDLLTDCLHPGHTYHAIAEWLVGLMIVERLPDAFPAPVEDE